MATQRASKRTTKSKRDNLKKQKVVVQKKKQNVQDKKAKKAPTKKKQTNKKTVSSATKKKQKLAIAAANSHVWFDVDVVGGSGRLVVPALSTVIVDKFKFWVQEGSGVITPNFDLQFQGVSFNENLDAMLGDLGVVEGSQITFFRLTADAQKKFQAVVDARLRKAIKENSKQGKM